MNIIVKAAHLSPAYCTACTLAADAAGLLTVHDGEDFINMYDGCAFE